MAILETLGVDSAAWVGTSMGGIIGYFAAAKTNGKEEAIGNRRRGPRITRLLLNDIGPSINPVSIEKIRLYGTAPLVADRFTQLEASLAAIYTSPLSFGIDSPELMRSLVEHGMRRMPDGQFTPHYDPNVVESIAVGNGTGVAGVDTWALYDKVECPTLVLRGANSELLLPEVVEEMGRRGPRARCVVIPQCGHAPALHTAEQIAVVVGFLAE
jgi:pimeloyl-ACP methyl ester carboxylesterase